MRDDEPAAKITAPMQGALLLWTARPLESLSWILRRILAVRNLSEIFGPKTGK